MTSLRRLTSPTLADRAADLLRERILENVSLGGDRLVEARIAEQLGISRGLLREALKQLAAEGLVGRYRDAVRSLPRRRWRDVRDAYDLRVALEGRRRAS